MSQEKKIAEGSKKAGHAQDLAAVNQLVKGYAAAWAKGDPELLLACYADDAVVIKTLRRQLVAAPQRNSHLSSVLGGMKGLTVKRRLAEPVAWLK